MSFYGSSFSFDGVSCEEYGLMLYDFGSTTHGNSEYAKVDIKEDRMPGRTRSLFYGTSYEDPLEFKLVFGAMEDVVNNDEPIDRPEMEVVAGWLTGHNEYKWLMIDELGLDSIRYRCIITDLKTIEVDMYKWAFECTVHCDSPYGYTLPEQFTYQVNGSTDVVLHSRSSTNSATYPIVSIRNEPYPTYNFTIPNGRMIGDVNGDGIIDSKDSDMLMQHVIQAITLSGDDLVCANTNNDEFVNINDSSEIVDYINGRISLHDFSNDIYGNWIWDDALNGFTVDIALEAAYGALQGVVLLNSSSLSWKPKIFCHNGFLKIVTDMPPINDVSASIVFINTGNTDACVVVSTVDEFNRYCALSNWSITNHSHRDETTILRNAHGGELTLNGNTGILSSSSGVNNYNNFNFVFPRLVRGKNQLTITGNGTVTFTCEFPVNVGG